MIIDELIAILGYDVRGEDNLKRFNKNLDDAGKKASALAAAVGKWAAIAGAAVAGGIGILGKGVIETSAAFEAYETTLETIEGSAEKAKKAMAWVSDFATKTPYDVAQVTDAFVKLKAYGIDPTDGSMQVIGNTASAMGKGLMQAVEAWADAMTGEFERLKEFGVKAKQEKDKVTFTWNEGGKEISKSVAKTGKEIQKFLNDTFGRKFDGAMMRQAKTWNGLWSNLGDAWVNFKRKIGDAGFFLVVKSRLADLLDTVGRWEADGTLTRAAKVLSDTFTAIADVVGLVASRVANHVAAINRNWEAMAPWLKAIGAGLLFLVARAFPLITAFMLLAVVVDDVLTYLEGGESVFGRWVDWLKEVTGLSDGAAQAFAGLGAALATALAGALIFKPGMFIMAGMKVGGWILAGVRLGITAGSLLLSLPGIILSGLSAGFAASGLTAALAGMLGPALSGALAIAIPLMFAGFGAAVLLYFRQDISDAFAAAGTWLAEQSRALARFFGVEEWYDAGVNAAQKLLEGLKSIGGKIEDWFRGILPDWAKGILDFDPVKAGAAAGKSVREFLGLGTEEPAGSGEGSAKPGSGSTGGWGSGASGEWEGAPKQPWRTKPDTSGGGPSLQDMYRNFAANSAKTGEAAAAAAVVTDNRVTNNTVTVSAPINMTVQQAVQAPAALAGAVKSSLEQGAGALPTRMQAGPVQ